VSAGLSRSAVSLDGSKNEPTGTDNDAEQDRDPADDSRRYRRVEFLVVSEDEVLEMLHRAEADGNGDETTENENNRQYTQRDCPGVQSEPTRRLATGTAPWCRGA
jgi:hypothetical protein